MRAIQRVFIVAVSSLSCVAATPAVVGNDSASRHLSFLAAAQGLAQQGPRPVPVGLATSDMMPPRSEQPRPRNVSLVEDSSSLRGGLTASPTSNHFPVKHPPELAGPLGRFLSVLMGSDPVQQQEPEQSTQQEPQHADVHSAVQGSETSRMERPAFSGWRKGAVDGMTLDVDWANTEPAKAEAGDVAVGASAAVPPSAQPGRQSQQPHQAFLGALRGAVELPSAQPGRQSQQQHPPHHQTFLSALRDAADERERQEQTKRAEELAAQKAKEELKRKMRLEMDNDWANNLGTTIVTNPEVIDSATGKAIVPPKNRHSLVTEGRHVNFTHTVYEDDRLADDVMALRALNHKPIAD